MPLTVDDVVAAANNQTNTFLTHVQAIEDAGQAALDAAAAKTAAENDAALVAASKGNVDALETDITNTLATLQAANPETRYVQTFTIGGSADYFYPVWWTMQSGAFGISKILFTREYNWNGGVGERPLNPSSGHQAHLTLEMEGQAYGWHGEANFLEVKRFFTRYNNTASHVSFLGYSKARQIDPMGDPLHGAGSLNFEAQSNNVSTVYLRGGGVQYRVVKNWAGDVSFHDGSDQLERVMHALGNTEWYGEPVALADAIVPTVTVNAFVDPV